MTVESLNSTADYLTEVQRALRAATKEGRTEAGRKLLGDANALVDGDGFLALPEQLQIEVLEDLSAAALAVTERWP